MTFSRKKTFFIQAFHFSTMFQFKILKQETKTRARRGILTTPHGEIHTPIFMPCGTAGAVKTVSPDELKQVGAQIILGNTYHLYLRPGHELIKKMGGLHKWINWDKPILTDSGGFQVFSLGANKKNHGEKGKTSSVKITEDGVEFKSHLDGSKHFFSPEKVIEIEHALGADIIMPLDECAPADSSVLYAKQALKRTQDWLEKCLKKHQELEKDKNFTELPQALFPIVQGVIFDELRKDAVKFCAELPTHGIAIGGLSVGEERAVMRHILEIMYPHFPTEKPRYLMGVGTPLDILESIERGIDMFDCVHATRIARHGCFYDEFGRQQIKNEIYKADSSPLQIDCACYACTNFSKSYIRHLIREQETFGARLLTIHNLHFLLELMQKIRESIMEDNFTSFKKDFLNTFKALN
jgi:queuine tRNA-ribosyltransferase